MWSPIFARLSPSIRASGFKPRASSALLKPLKLTQLTAHTPFRSSRNVSLQTFSTMNSQELAQYLADAPPTVVRLEIEKHFEALTDKQKRYAHFISK